LVLVLMLPLLHKLRYRSIIFHLILLDQRLSGILEVSSRRQLQNSLWISRSILGVFTGRTECGLVVPGD
jgi:sulfite exporter TauE/SafE